MVTQGSTVTTTDYIDGIQYTNNVLDFIPTAEGYVKNTVVNGTNTYSYVYNYTDHLGNVRLSYAKSPSNVLTILEENNYYPFGMKHSGYNGDGYSFGSVSNALALVANGVQSYQYKYQGQERQDELGLGWDSFKHRNYDYALGRFMSIDPLAEKYPHNGVYNFSENRVVDGVELEGLEVVLINPTKSSSTEQQKQADRNIVKGAKNIPNSSTMVTVTGHGNPQFMANDVRDQRIETGKQLDAVLTRNSDAWKNRESNEGMTVVLYACRTGSDVKDNKGNSTGPGFAQSVSASPEFKDVEIIAPDQRLYFTSNGPIGTYEAKYAGPNDEYKRDEDGNVKSTKMSDTPGNWNVYKNGELIRSYKGDWTPTDSPSMWDSLFKEN